jgi:hypothetical protein
MRKLWLEMGPVCEVRPSYLDTMHTLEWQTSQVISVLLNQELLAPVFIGLVVDLTGKNRPFLRLKPIFKPKQVVERLQKPPSQLF